MQKVIGLTLLASVLLSACAPSMQAGPGNFTGGSATPKEVFDAYNAALNANDVALLMTRVTDDIVWMPQQQPSIVGKKDAAAFVTGLFALGKIKFEITSVEAVENGGWAYNRYVESLTLTDKAGVSKTWPSKGLIILQKGKDGTWLVARDSFSDSAK